MTCVFFFSSGLREFLSEVGVTLQKDGHVHSQRRSKSAMTVPSQVATASGQFVTRRGRLVSETKTLELWNMN